MQVLVATAMISITVNPLLFSSLDRIEAALRRWPTVWNVLNHRHARRTAALNRRGVTAAAADSGPLAIIAGYGPVGRVVDAMLRDAKMDTVVIDMNIDTVRQLSKGGRAALYGDAMRAAGASVVIFDEGETGVALARHVLERRALAPAMMNEVLSAIRRTWKMDGTPQNKSGTR